MYNLQYRSHHHHHHHTRRHHQSTHISPLHIEFASLIGVVEGEEDIKRQEHEISTVETTWKSRGKRLTPSRAPIPVMITEAIRDLRVNQEKDFHPDYLLRATHAPSEIGLPMTH
jgi:hypothetical protein